MGRDAVGVLVPAYDAEPGHPAARPIGRAALRLEAEGLAVVFGHEARDGTLSGLRATPQGWASVHDVPLAAAYDRFPSRSRSEAHGALMAGLDGVAVANAPEVVLLCADKLLCQQQLEAAGLPGLPEQLGEPEAFPEALARWGQGFLKPRFGAFGCGVRRVTAGDAVVHELPGPLPGVMEPALLQRAVPPPDGWAGVACRVLVQRTGPSSWWAEEPVARRSPTDPVVNAARGAEVVPLRTGFPAAMEPTRSLAVQVAHVLSGVPGGELLVELGVDLVLDRELQPWVIEVNSRPRGRLEALATADPRWMEAHVEACARPLRFLADW